MFYLFFSFIFGLMIGSFLNCLIWRLHKKEKITGRSYCPKCKKQIVWYDNIPVLSFLFLRGRCRYCGKGISWQYPVVELVTGVLFMFALLINVENVTNFGFEVFDLESILYLLRDWLVIGIMIVIFIYDLRWYMILDIVTLPAMVVVLMVNLLLGFSWLNLLISGIIGGSFFLVQFVVSRGEWIGGGDIRLGLLMGFILGWPNVLVAIFIAYFMGSIIGVGLKIWGGKKWDSKVPLGTFLSVATIITLFWGQNILSWYLNLIYIK